MSTLATWLKNVVAPVALLWAIGGLCHQAGAEVIGYSVNSDGAVNVDHLLRVDLETGEWEAIGPVGFLGVEGLTWTDGSLYGFDDVSSMPIAIDPSTGQGRQVASGPSGLPPAMDYGLAATCDGTIYVAVENTQSLYRLELDPFLIRNVATVGSLGASITGMAADSEGLWGVSTGADSGLYRIDPESGVAHLVGPLNIGSAVDDAGLGIDAEGRLWLVADRSLPDFLPSLIVEIDRNTGAGQIVGETAVGLESLAIDAPPCASGGSASGISTLSINGILILIVLLSFVSLRYFASSEGRAPSD